MSRYKFPLQKLLSIRTDQEEDSKRVFMEAVRQKNIAEENLNILKDNYKKYNISNIQEVIAERRIRNLYLTTLINDIHISESDLQTKQDIVEYKRNDLKQKQIDRKTVEKLKEKGTEEFINEQNSIEQKQNDEFAVFGFKKRN